MNRLALVALILNWSQIKPPFLVHDSLAYMYLTLIYQYAYVAAKYFSTKYLSTKYLSTKYFSTKYFSTKYLYKVSLYKVSLYKVSLYTRYCYIHYTTRSFLKTDIRKKVSFIFLPPEKLTSIYSWLITFDRRQQYVIIQNGCLKGVYKHKNIDFLWFHTQLLCQFFFSLL